VRVANHSFDEHWELPRHPLDHLRTVVRWLGVGMKGSSLSATGVIWDLSAGGPSASEAMIPSSGCPPWQSDRLGPAEGRPPTPLLGTRSLSNTHRHFSNPTQGLSVLARAGSHVVTWTECGFDRPTRLTVDSDNPGVSPRPSRFPRQHLCHGASRGDAWLRPPSARERFKEHHSGATPVGPRFWDSLCHSVRSRDHGRRRR
jgi:hypothetical protein